MVGWDGDGERRPAHEKGRCVTNIDHLLRLCRRGCQCRRVSGHHHYHGMRMDGRWTGHWTGDD